MFIQIEGISKKEKENGEFHFVFTLVLAFPEEGVITTKGWRYYPSSGSVQSPSVKHGASWLTTVWLMGKMHDRVVEEVQDYFVTRGFCEEPWELGTKKKKEKKK